MRYFIFTLAAVLILSFGAGAQENPAFARVLATPYFTVAPVSGAIAPALTAPLGLASATSAPASFASAANAAPTSPAADPPQMVQGVYVNYSWQAYAGYTFFRFYEAPGVQQDTNGFNVSMQYYFLDWFGIDGELMATQTSLNAFNGWFLFGGGGPRFRWSGPRGLELWGHALVGYSHLTPQTSFGSQDAFAYEAGGGVDFNLRHSRWALRVGADMVGSRYFNDNQYSPKAFAGVVYKF
jgi:hypothetical protein